MASPRALHVHPKPEDIPSLEEFLEWVKEKYNQLYQMCHAIFRLLTGFSDGNQYCDSDEDREIMRPSWFQVCALHRFIRRWLFFALGPFLEILYSMPFLIWHHYEGCNCSCAFYHLIRIIVVKQYPWWSPSPIILIVILLVTFNIIITTIIFITISIIIITRSSSKLTEYCASWRLERMTLLTSGKGLVLTVRSIDIISWCD